MNRMLILSLYSGGFNVLPITLICVSMWSCKTESADNLKRRPQSQLINEATHPDQFHELMSLLLTTKTGTTLSEVFQHFRIPAPASDDPATYAFTFSYNLEGSETWYEFSDRYAVTFFSERYDKFSEAKALKISNISLYVRVSVDNHNLEDWRMIRPYWENGIIVSEH